MEKLNFTFEKIILGKDKKKIVLEVVPKKLEFLRTLSEIIDSWGGYYKYLLFNVDIRLSTRYLQDKGVFCNANIRWDGKKFELNDEQWAIDYKMPNYTSTILNIKRKSKSKIMSFESPIKSIKIGNTTIAERCEADTILLAIKQLKQEINDGNNQ